MKKHWLDLEKGRLCYYSFGKGERLLIAIHGFADTARTFASLEKELGNTYTILAFDLPWHGFTSWHRNDFTQTDVLELIERLLEKYKQFDIAGHSLGGRIILSLYPKLEAIGMKQIFFLAPEGLSCSSTCFTNLFPVFLRKLLKKLARYPQWFLSLCRALNKVAILPKFTNNYFQHHLSNERRRKRLFNTWIAQKQFPVKRPLVKATIKREKTRTVFVFGKNDKILGTKVIQKTKRNYPGAEIIILDEGHYLINENLGLTIRKLLF